MYKQRSIVFNLPHVPYDQQLMCCLSIMRKQHRELLPLRKNLQNYHTQFEQLKQQIQIWKEKYQKKKEELTQAKRENTILKKEIEKLTKTNNRYQVALFDHGNFKSSTNKNKKTKGGQMGHSDTNREACEDYSSYHRKRLFVQACGKCGCSLSRVSTTRQKILLDIIINPKILKLIIESERQWCGSCKMEVYARDSQSLPFTEYGINTFMLILILRFKCHASLTNIATVIRISHGLSLSTSDVVNLLKQTKTYFASRYEKLIETVRQGAIMYNDETGWQVAGQSAWLWIMANENTTVYFAAESRGGGIMKELYGNSCALSMHDGFASYRNTIPADKQCYCWAHFLRFVHEEMIFAKEGTQEFALKDKLVKIYHIKAHHPEYSIEKLKQILLYELDKIMNLPSENQSIIAIQQRLKVQKQGLINSLVYTRDGTNNLAERELRTMVINKKISNGSQTFSGMETTAIAGSIVQTVSKKETDTINLLQN